MKNLQKLFLIVPVIVLFFLSCTKDSDDETIQFNINVSVTPSDGGTVSPSSGTYDEGTVVTMEGTPSNGYSFVEWTGSIQSRDNPVSITMDSDMDIIGVFEILDSDEDGVTDDLDTCPDTPSGEQVDENGCSLPQSDSDEDGVVDNVDNCPDTPSGETVDENGCSDSQKDTDGDGVTDDLDLCSDTPQGENVDENGCPTPSPIYLDVNGVTIKCYEWGKIGVKGVINGVIYTVVNETMLREMVRDGEDVTKVCTTKVTDMNGLFSSSPFNQDISSWDVSNVTNMSYMFFGSLFNQDIGTWDVSNVTDMNSMFNLSQFNQDIGSWDVSKVTNMSSMFSSHNMFNVDPVPFNQDIGSWDVSNVTNMSSMFSGSLFNQDIGTWDVGNVTNMSFMFSGSLFNQDIGSWDTSNVTNMSFMFSGSLFNQDIGTWDVSNVTNMSFMFSGSLFNQDLGGWIVDNVIDCFEFSSNTPQWILPKPNFMNCNL